MLQPGAPNAVESARSGTFQQYRGRSSSTVEAAAAAETPAVDCRHRCNPCPHHQCHSHSHYRFRLRHHQRHPRLNDRSLPTPRTGRGPVGTVTTASTVDFQGPQPPQPSPASPSSPLPPSWPQHPALPSVATCGRAFLPSYPHCEKWACNGHFPGPVWS